MLRKVSTALSKAVHGAEHHRAYVYRVAATTGTLLVGGGRLTAGHESALLTLLGAVLGLGGTGLAAANTSIRKRKPRATGGIISAEAARRIVGQQTLNVTAADAMAIEKALLKLKRKRGGSGPGLG